MKFKEIHIIPYYNHITLILSNIQAIINEISHIMKYYLSAIKHSQNSMFTLSR